MNKTLRLSKSGIEYLTHCWNFYSGCYNWKNGVCPVEKCWAKGITERFPGHYPNGFEPTIYPEAFLSPLHLKKPSIIGCAFMGDLFGDWVDPTKMINVPMVPGLSHAEPLREQVFRTINQCPQHTFLFLTKCPQNLTKFSPFPENCWVGVTATNWLSFSDALGHLATIEAKIKYLSFEPLLEEIKLDMLQQMLFPQVIDWVIIGAQTKPYKPPDKLWVTEIIEACKKANVPVFLKDNLLSMDLPYDDIFFPYECPGSRHLRQEMPK